MNGQNGLYHYLHNPDEYVKQKEYIKKKKLLYGNELRLQIEENNRIKNQMTKQTKRLKFPKITNNNKNSFYHQNYNDISKDNNDNNIELNNNFNNSSNQNFLKTLTQNFTNQKQINDNDININIINDKYLNGNNLNIQEIFNNFVEDQINAIDDYISSVDKIVDVSKHNDLNDNKNKDENNMNEIEVKNIYHNKNNENINEMKKIIDKEKKKIINNINSEKEKLKNKLGYFPEEVNYNKRIEDLFNKIIDKKIAKYSSISPRNNYILNIKKDNPDLNENNLNINNNSEKNLKNNNSKYDNNNNNDRENNNSNNFESNSNNIINFSNNYNENNNYNAKNKNNNIDNNKDNQNIFMDNYSNINNNVKENNSNNDTLLKPSKKNFLNIESNNQKYDFAFKNNSFNNNSDANKSFKSEEVNDDNNLEEDKSLSNSNSNSKEEENNVDDDDYLIRNSNNNYNNNDNENKNNANNTNFILSKKDNIIDIFSRNEKNRIKKFSEGYKINDNKKYKEIKLKKNISKKTFTLPVNQNFKNIKNISKDIKIKSFKTMKNNILAQKSYNFFRTRSKSQGKKSNIKLKKKIDGNNNQIDNILADYYNKNNSKNLSYSYNDSKLKNKLNIDKKVNISHNNDNIKEKRNKIPRKKKVSIQNEEISGMIGNTEPNTFLANRSNRSNIIVDKKYNIFNKRSSSYAHNSKIYPLDKVEYRQSRTMNELRKRSGSSFITGMNIINNQFLPNIVFDRGNDRDDDRLYRMIKNFEESIKERIRIEEGKEIKQIPRTSNLYSNNNLNINMNNMNNNILFRNNTKNFGEVELIPKKYIYRCKKIIFPEVESEKIKERERLLFGKSKIN